MATRTRTDRWHNTGGNGPASTVWVRKIGDKSVVISVRRDDVVVDHWEGDPFTATRVCTMAGTFWPDLDSAKKAADTWLGVKPRKPRNRGLVKLRKFTDEFGQEWTDWAGAAPVDPMTRRIMVREAIDSLRQRKQRGEANARGYLSTFVSSGEALYTVELHGDDTVSVHACKVLAHTWNYK